MKRSAFDLSAKETTDDLWEVRLSRDDSPKGQARALRFQAKPGAYITYVEGAGAIQDLSMDGVFVLDPRPLPVGTKISFTLHVGSQALALHGIVRRSVAAQGMGIQFADISPEVKRRLESCLTSLF